MPATITTAPPARTDLIRLPRSQWTIWSTAALRGAGFPAAEVLRLSSPECARLASRWLQMRGRRDAATRDVLKQTFERETRRTRAALGEMARDPAFREAVLWQNRRALKHCVEPLARASLAGTPAVRVTSDIRKHELLMVNYLQRYCVKNDTIGFFGPVGWAALSHQPVDFSITPGPRLTSVRNLYFESWCIDAIARALDADPELRPWQLPRLNAFVRLDGAQVIIGAQPARTLSPDEVLLFIACDGAQPAKALAEELRTRCPRTFATDDDVYDRLERWHRAGYLTWSFEGPRELHPESTLQRRLEAIDDPRLRARATARLAEIVSAAADVRAAAGAAEVMEPAMVRLEETFTRITGIASTRADGQMYAARTLVYEDCRRDVTAVIGAELLGRLGPPLTLVLHAARWAIHELSRRHAAALGEAFDALAGSDRAPVGLGTFLSRTSLFGRASGTLSAIDLEVRAELQRRWAALLSPPPGARRVLYRGRDLQAAVRRAFDTPAAAPSSWARYVSPDVMIAAASVDAIQRGAYQLVLGEIHIVNTLLQGVFIDQHPCRETLLRSVALDCPEPRVVWIGPKDTTPHRVHYYIGPNDFGYTGTRDPSPLPPARTLRIADLVVADVDGTLMVQTRDGRQRFSCLEFFGTPTMRTGSSVFSVLPPSPHRPRIVIEDLVICREQWQVAAADIGFAARGDDLDRFVECQRWAYGLGLPQFVFVKMPTERKPTYVDFASPLFVDLFARYVRALQRKDPASLVTITEMLPTHDETWLTDAAGARYTSELRLVAVDPSVCPAEEALQG